MRSLGAPVRARRLTAALLGALLVATLAGPIAQAASDKAGFMTSADPMLSPVAGDVEVKPLLTVGDTIGDYQFEAIPDGIAIDPRGHTTFDVYVNHETSTVPFPATLVDFDNAQLSHLVMKRGSGRILSGELAIDSSSNYQRFCSNFFAGPAEGFDTPLVITNEETSDFVNRTGTAWPAVAGAEQAGLAVAYNPETGQHRSIYGLGRMNHENSVAVPGYDEAVLVTGDDTFSAPSSQLYMYTAADAMGVWNDSGHLWAFVSDDADVNDYGDLSSGEEVSGSFIQVPDAIADGDQTALENWSNANNVFQFIRIEDLAYDRTDHNVVYFADTGEPRARPWQAGDPAALETRLVRGSSSTRGAFPNGRIFKLVLDAADPLTVDSLSILVDADAGGYNNAAVLHQPDNVETTANSVLITEDPGGHNRFAGATNARVWQYDLASGEMRVVAVVSDPTADWESSGITDASQYFGNGAFLINVQAHNVFVDTAPLPSNPSITQKREGGQLLLLRIEGA